MKTFKLVIVLGLICFGWGASAQQVAVEKAMEFSKNILLFDLGLRSPTGLLGVSYEYEITPHHGVFGGVGVDANGSVLSAGYRFYDGIISVKKTNTFLDKCFFIFTCEDRPFVGVSLTKSFGGSVLFDPGTATERKFQIERAMMAGVDFGFQTIYKSGFVTSLSFTYRTPLDRPSINLVSGKAQSEDDYNMRSWYQGLGLGVGLGYNY